MSCSSHGDRFVVRGREKVGQIQESTARFAASAFNSYFGLQVLEVFQPTLAELGADGICIVSAAQVSLDRSARFFAPLQNRHQTYVAEIQAFQAEDSIEVRIPCIARALDALPASPSLTILAGHSSDDPQK